MNVYITQIIHKGRPAAWGTKLRGKRMPPTAREFMSQLDSHLRTMHQQLLAGNVLVGQFWQFEIHDPKDRIITSPWTAWCKTRSRKQNVCEPHFDRWLIDDTFDCRRGKGRITVLSRAHQFSERFPFYLRLDIRECFDSVPQQQLAARLRLQFKERHLQLLDRVIRSFREPLGCGLSVPIDNLGNLGPANAAWLREVGITTIAELERLGPALTYRLVKQKHSKSNLNLL